MNCGEIRLHPAAPDVEQTNFSMSPEVVLALLTRGVQGLVLAAAAVCVVLYLSPAEQGVFFVYMSLGTLVQLSDFGLSYATLQTASHLAGPDGERSFYAFRAKAH